MQEGVGEKRVTCSGDRKVNCNINCNECTTSIDTRHGSTTENGKLQGKLIRDYIVFLPRLPLLCKLLLQLIHLILTQLHSYPRSIVVNLVSILNANCIK